MPFPSSLDLTPTPYADTVNRNYDISGSDMYDLFGKYGAIRQVRLGNDAAAKTKGTAYVVSVFSWDRPGAGVRGNGPAGLLECVDGV